MTRLSPSLLKEKALPLLWPVFLIWSGVGVLIMAFGITDTAIGAWHLPWGLIRFLQGCLHWGDFVFMALGAGVIARTAVERVGASPTLISFLTVAIGSAIVETIGTLTGFPFGSYTYMGKMGPQLGPLPLAIPLAWWCVVGGASLTLQQDWETVGRALRSALFKSGDPAPAGSPYSEKNAIPSRNTIALCVGVFAVVFDWMLEPFAWRVREYWVWHDGSVPLANYVSWFLLSVFFARIIPLQLAPPAHSRPVPKDRRPIGVLLLMVLLFIVGRLAD